MSNVSGPLWDAELLSELRAAGEDLTDMIEVRKAADNRARTLSHLDTELIRPDWVDTAEKAARAALRDRYEAAVPEQVRDWAATVPGFGSGELFPRLIAAIGDPAIATPLLPIEPGDTGRGARSRPAGEPYVRSLRQLFQYCGVGDTMLKPREDVLGRKPEREDVLRAGKRDIQPLLYTWSTLLLRGQRHASVSESRYWDLLTARLLLTRGHEGACDPGKTCFGSHRVHERQCQNHQRPPRRSDGCGTVQNPEWGAPGSPWRPGHISMDAHRTVQKTLLADLWRVSREGRNLPNPETGERRERRRR